MSFNTLSKIVNVVYIVFLYLVFQFLITYTYGFYIADELNHG